MPAVRSKTDVDVDSEAEVETKVDEGLDKLYETYQKREAVANTQLVAIIEYVRDNKLSRAVVKATLQHRGLSDSSVSTELSRIMALSRDENREIVQRLEDGEITVAAARKAIATPQERPARSPVDKLWEMLYKAAKFAYKESGTNPDFTLKYFSTEAANAWNAAKEEHEAKVKEAQERAEQEAEEAGEEAEAEEVTA